MSKQMQRLSSLNYTVEMQSTKCFDDTVHEMARDEARHGKAFEGLLKRYFN